jgi:hypothetical protein
MDTFIVLSILTVAFAILAVDISLRRIADRLRELVEQEECDCDDCKGV